MNDGWHYPNSIRSLLLPESNFDLLLSFRNTILPLPQFSKASIMYLYVTILPCNLVTRHQHMLGVLCVYFLTILITSAN
jgi:hypothetical protein